LTPIATGRRHSATLCCQLPSSAYNEPLERVGEHPRRVYRRRPGMDTERCCGADDAGRVLSTDSGTVQPSPTLCKLVTHYADGTRPLRHLCCQLPTFPRDEALERARAHHHGCMDDDWARTLVNATPQNHSRTSIRVATTPVEARARHQPKQAQRFARKMIPPGTPLASMRPLYTPPYNTLVTASPWPIKGGGRRPAADMLNKHNLHSTNHIPFHDIGTSPQSS
jgi:hypothetical protein